MTEHDRGSATTTAPLDPTPLPFVLLSQLHGRESSPTGTARAVEPPTRAGVVCGVSQFVIATHSPIILEQLLAD
jgi:hypothetical protein